MVAIRRAFAAITRWRGNSRGSGQAMVEFALVAPMLFLLILGTIEAGRFIFFQELLNHATREGARYAIVHGNNGKAGVRIIDNTGGNAIIANNEPPAEPHTPAPD